MSVPSSMSDLMTLWDTISATSLLASECGATPFEPPDGPTINQSGLAPVPASPSPPQENAEAQTTLGISGPSSSVSSRSVDLSQSLASRLRARTDSLGSTLYTLTWKVRATPLGRSIPALRASVRRTSDSGCTSWPTPQSRDMNGEYKNHTKGGRDLTNESQLASWPTPTTRDHKDSGENVDWQKVEAKCKLAGSAQLTSWPTPTESMMTENDLVQAMFAGNGNRPKYEEAQLLASWKTPNCPRKHDSDNSAGRGYASKKQKDLPDQVVSVVGGETLTGSSASIRSTGQLNPAHSRWLMGLPPEWDDCGVTAMPSSRRKRQRS